jgi:hypothetical protein
MLIREIHKKNLIEIIILPLIFISIFIAGTIILTMFNILNYMIYAGWCLISGIMLMIIVWVYSYIFLKEDRFDQFRTVNRINNITHPQHLNINKPRKSDDPKIRVQVKEVKQKKGKSRAKRSKKNNR